MTEIPIENENFQKSIFLHLKRSVEANLRDGKVQEEIGPISALAGKLFPGIEGLKGLYLDVCLERKTIFEPSEFMQLLAEQPDILGRLQESDAARYVAIITEFHAMALPPRVFISYSHDSPAHKQWVLKLATKLRENGVDVSLDQWDLVPPMDVTRFMEENLQKALQVVVVCTKGYLQKATAANTGVGYERMIINRQLSEDIGTQKFLPIVREGSGTGSPLPTFLGTRIYIDFRDDSMFDDSLMRLLRVIHHEPEAPKPPIGANPFVGTKIQGS